MFVRGGLPDMRDGRALQEFDPPAAAIPRLRQRKLGKDPAQNTKTSILY